MKSSNVGQFLAFAAASYAQVQTRGMVGELYLNSQGDYECSEIAESSGAIGVSIFNNFTESCYDLAEIFAAEEITVDDSSSCVPGTEDCENDYQTLMAQNFNADANYSSAAFRVVTGQIEQEYNVEATNLTIQLFGAEGCADWSEQRLFQAGGCDEEDFTCTELPWNVVSFMVMATPDHNPSTCEFAQLPSAGIRGKSMSYAAALVAVVAGGVSLFL